MHLWHSVRDLPEKSTKESSQLAVHSQHGGGPPGDAGKDRLLKSVAELFKTIPEAYQLQRPLQVPASLCEMELQQHMTELAAKNICADQAVCFLGGGSYDHFIPAVVDTVSSRSEFYTAYTPYQAEASQGSLQAFFEFQTLLCQLTGLDVSNASLYEGGSAVAESVLMAISIDSERRKVLIPESVHPEYRQTLATYLANLPAEVVGAADAGRLS